MTIKYTYNPFTKKLDSVQNLDNVDGGISNVDYIQFNTSNTPVADSPGLIQWNQTFGTYDMGLLNNSVLQVGQEMMFYGKASENISNGDVCQFNGVEGDHILIKKAVGAEIDANPHYLLGIATQNITSGSFGYVTWFGNVNNVYTKTPNNNDSVDWVAGDILYFNTTTGQLMKAETTVPNTKIIVAAVIKEQTGSSETGRIVVRPTFTPKLEDLSDVNGTPLAKSGQFPVWDQTNGYFDFDYNIYDAFEEGGDLTGFEKSANGAPPTDSTLSYDPVTRTISVAPTGTSFNYWLKGQRYEVTTTQSKIHDNITGGYFMYWNSSNVLTLSSTPWSLIEDVPIAFVYYNSTLVAGLLFEERHGSDRNRQWHNAQHFLAGTYWRNGDGLAIADYTLTPGSPIDSDNQFSITTGYARDEDIRNTIDALASGNYYMVYREGSGTDWTWSNNNVPNLNGGSYMYWNEFTGGSWQLTVGTNGNYHNAYVIVAPAVSGYTQIFVVVDQNEHANLADAQSETIGDLNTTGFPFQEVLAIYKLTFRLSASYTTEGKCRIEALEDTRLTTARQVISATPTANHNSLGGLQGGAAGEYYHLTATRHTDLTDGGDSTLHYHATDRALSNATGTLAVANGGTSTTSLTPYAVLCGGTSTTSAIQSIVSVGTSGQILTSNGAGALPTFQTFTGDPDNFSYHTIATGETVTIPENQQMSVHDTLNIEGTLDLTSNAELVLRS